MLPKVFQQVIALGRGLDSFRKCPHKSPASILSRLFGLTCNPSHSSGIFSRIGWTNLWEEALFPCTIRQGRSSSSWYFRLETNMSRSWMWISQPLDGRYQLPYFNAFVHLIELMVSFLFVIADFEDLFDNCAHGEGHILAFYHIQKISNAYQNIIEHSSSVSSSILASTVSICCCRRLSSLSIV